MPLIDEVNHAWKVLQRIQQDDLILKYKDNPQTLKEIEDEYQKHFDSFVAFKDMLLKPSPKHENIPVVEYRSKVEAFEKRLRAPLPPPYDPNPEFVELPSYEEAALQGVRENEAGGV